MCVPDEVNLTSLQSMPAELKWEAWTWLLWITGVRAGWVLLQSDKGKIELKHRDTLTPEDAGYRLVAPSLEEG
jgi:hypothetical protein